ncbi:MAG: AAA-like domain-containing protein [Xenococcaceae cyanobacterium]
MTAFIAGGALNPQKHQNIIIHRPELDLILEHLEREDLYIILQSPRQTGKTTLLYQIQDCLHGKGYGVVYLDLAGLNHLSESEFYQTICTESQEQLTGLIDDTSGILSEPKNAIHEIGFVEYLTSLATNTPEARKLVFMLDEVGGVPEDSLLYPTLRRFFHEGRSSSNESDLCRKFIFIFSGALELDRLLQGFNSPLANICKTFTLNDFSQEQVAELGKNLENFSSQILQTIFDCVDEWCSGHPYLTQRLFALIDESKECRETKNIEDLSKAIEKLVNHYFIYGNDVNIAHVKRYLDYKDKSYRDSVWKVIHNQTLLSIPHGQELTSFGIGILKRSEEYYLIIRNPIYEKALKNYCESKSES